MEPINIIESLYEREIEKMQDKEKQENFIKEK